MITTATIACDLVGRSRKLTELGPADGARLLKALRERPLSPKSVQDYYSNFRRVLTLADISTVRWPKAPTPPRRTRDALTEDAFGAIVRWLDGRGFAETSDLCRVLAATGMRIAVEALSPDAIGHSSGDQFDTLKVVGKGGHERLIPVMEGQAREVLRDSARLAAIRSLSYSAHLKRFKRAAKATGVTSRLATPHAVRHSYASEALRKSGGNLVLVQELLGHASPTTTARYLHVDLADKAQAVKARDTS